MCLAMEAVVNRAMCRTKKGNIWRQSPLQEVFQFIPSIACQALVQLAP